MQVNRRRYVHVCLQIMNREFAMNAETAIFFAHSMCRNAFVQPRFHVCLQITPTPAPITHNPTFHCWERSQGKTIENADFHALCSLCYTPAQPGRAGQPRLASSRPWRAPHPRPCQPQLHPDPNPDHTKPYLLVPKMKTNAGSKIEHKGKKPSVQQTIVFHLLCRVSFFV